MTVLDLVLIVAYFIFVALIGFVFLLALFNIGTPALSYGLNWVNWQRYSASYNLVGEETPFTFNEAIENCTTLSFKLHNVGDVWLDNDSGVYDKNDWRIIEVRKDWTCLKRGE